MSVTDLEGGRYRSRFCTVLSNRSEKAAGVCFASKAIAKAQALALRVLADRLEHSEVHRSLLVFPSLRHEPVLLSESDARARRAVADRLEHQA